MEKGVLGVEKDVGVLTATSAVVYLGFRELAVIESVPSEIVLTETLARSIKEKHTQCSGLH